jgi:hypothetical protein
MTKSTTNLGSFCAKRILPAAAALVFALTGGHAMASTDGQNAILAKLKPQFIPTINAAKLPTIQTAKQADVLLALTLALEDPANAALLDTHAKIAGFAEAVLEAPGGKTRADKDKIAGQIVATAIATLNLYSDPDAVAKITTAVFNVNAAGSTKVRLSGAGQGSAIATGIKLATNGTNDDFDGHEIGLQIAAAFSGDVVALLSNVSTGMGSSTSASSLTLQNFVDGLFDGGDVGAGASNTVKAAAEKVAVKNPAAAGAFFGGLVINNPATDRSTLATDVLADTKLAKALGEIYGATMGSLGPVAKLAVIDTLLSSAKKPSATAQALIAQGFLRASANDGSEVNNIIDKFATVARVSLASAAVVGSGNNQTKLDLIVKRIAGNLDALNMTKVGAAAIGAVGAAAPVAGRTITEAIFASPGSTFTNDTARLKFGTDNIGKIKAFAAAGYMAAAIVDASPTKTAANATDLAAALIKKGAKAAADVARQVSLLSFTGGKADFADLLTDKAKSAVQSIAVGVSLADPLNSGAITARAITHDPLDKSAPAKAAKIASAVATALDEEQAANIGQALADVMSDGGKTLGKPIKTSAAAAVATSLAKAVQAKPGVKAVNRMDELGEIAAALTSFVLGKSTTDAAQAKLIAGIGSAVLKTLSKSPTLSDNPNTSVNAALVATGSTVKADYWEARDIAGSIAQTIFASGLTASQKSALIGTVTGAGTHTAGSLETAFLKLSGKKGTPTYNAVTAAFQTVLDNQGAAKFEIGSVVDKETDTKNG